MVAMDPELRDQLELDPVQPTQQFSLLSAIRRCDALVDQIRQIQMEHSENLCRVANRLAAGEVR